MMKTRCGTIGGALVGVAGVFLLGSCSELKQNLPAPVTATVTVHESGWGDVNSPNFHGLALKANNWDDADCQRCHGQTFSGGTSGVACFTCHDAYPHSVKFARSTGRHQGYLRAHNFPLTQCQACHGTSYTGGPVVTVSCESASCHADANGNLKPPDACNTCHGQFRAAASDFLSAAPPASVAGDTATTFRGVGAHQMHLVIASLARPVKCQECHTVPQSAFTPSHPVGLPASVVFQDTLARLASGDGSFVPSPQYDAADGKCNNTYCHGNWRLRKATSAYPDPGVWSDSVMTGANFSPVWNGGGAQATCATCHSSASGGTTYPVPAGHAPATLANCSFCHTGVVDATGKIIDKTKHMNGKANVFGTERRM